MQQVSSNLTLMLRIFFPVLLTVFFGAFRCTSGSTTAATTGMCQERRSAIVFTAFYLGMLAVFALTVWRLRRVEMGRDWVYVTDFFRQARYPWGNIESPRDVDRDRAHRAGALLRTREFWRKRTLHSLGESVAVVQGGAPGAE